MTAAESKRERATPLPPEGRRSAIVEAVVPLLIEHGPSVTTRQIAEAAGVAEGTLFRVFPDKKALLLAVAEHLVDPNRGEQALISALSSTSDLPSKVMAAVAHLRDRMHDVTLVIMALRHAILSEGKTDGHPQQPPAFLAEANRGLLEALAAHVFAPHQNQLRITPAEAALVLRSQVFGMWHPGIAVGEPMAPDHLAAVLLEGMAR